MVTNTRELPSGERSSDDVHGVNTDDRNFILPVSVKVRDVVLPTDLGEHPNDDSEKAAEFWHT